MHRELLALGYLVLAVVIAPALAGAETPIGSANEGTAASTPFSNPVVTPPVVGIAIDLQAIVARMEKAQRENPAHFHPYTIFRDYQLFGSDNESASSEVVARINFAPPDAKTYTIEKTSGPDRAEKVVRRILDREVEMARKKQSSAVLDRESYDFSYLGTGVIGGHLCFVVGLEPKRSVPELVRGRVWIDQATYMPRLVDGEMAKSPSWWIKSVHLRLSFTVIDGLWLQAGTEAVADVRLLGRHILTSRAVDVFTPSTVALNYKSQLQIDNSIPSSAVLGAVGSRDVRNLLHGRPVQSVPALIGIGVISRR